MDKNIIDIVEDILSNLSMDKNVDDILSKSQYGQKRRVYHLISLVNLSMDKNVDDILSNSQYGQKRR